MNALAAGLVAYPLGGVLTSYEEEEDEDWR